MFEELCFLGVVLGVKSTAWKENNRNNMEVSNPTDSKNTSINEPLSQIESNRYIPRNDDPLVLV